MVNELDTKYYQAFGHSNSGSDVLDDLITMFHAQDTFVLDNERLSCYKQGQRAVVDYILTRMQQAERQTTV